jgi:hypothetical protein
VIFTYVPLSCIHSQPRAIANLKGFSLIVGRTIETVGRQAATAVFLDFRGSTPGAAALDLAHTGSGYISGVRPSPAVWDADWLGRLWPGRGKYNYQPRR